MTYVQFKFFWFYMGFNVMAVVMILGLKISSVDAACQRYFAAWRKESPYFNEVVYNFRDVILVPRVMVYAIPSSFFATFNVMAVLFFGEQLFDATWGFFL